MTDTSVFLDLCSCTGSLSGLSAFRIFPLVPDKTVSNKGDLGRCDGNFPYFQTPALVSLHQFHPYNHTFNHYPIAKLGWFVFFPYNMYNTHSKEIEQLLFPHKMLLFDDIVRLEAKGSTINALGGGQRKYRPRIFFPRRSRFKFIFFSGRPLEIFFFLEMGLRNFFFSIFSAPPPSLMVEP